MQHGPQTLCLVLLPLQLTVKGYSVYSKLTSPAGQFISFKKQNLGFILGRPSQSFRSASSPYFATFLALLMTLFMYLF